MDQLNQREKETERQSDWQSGIFKREGDVKTGGQYLEKHLSEKAFSFSMWRRDVEIA